MSEKKVVLRAENLSIGYDDREKNILHDLSFCVNSGEMIGLIGPNGAGKSTLLKTLRGLLAPHQGKIFLNGKNTQDLTERDFAHIVAYLQQTLSISFGYSVKEIVMAGRYPHLSWWQKENEHDEKIVRACMAYTGVQDLAEKSINEISGGQRQRVLLAKVLAQQTPVLFLDEPATGLDIFYQEEIFRLSRELCQAGKTILMVVHELSLAARFCSRLFLVGQGKIFADGVPEEVLTEKNLSAVYDVPVRVVKNSLLGTYEIFTEAKPSEQDARKKLLHLILN